MNELEERLHSEHVHEEEELHEAHLREENQLHLEHVHEEEELRHEAERHDHEHGYGEVTVIAPSGAPVTEKYRPEETVETLFSRARKTLVAESQLDPSKEYILVQGDTPLNNNLTLEAAGVHAGATLKIRSKEIPGDGNAS